MKTIYIIALLALPILSFSQELASANKPKKTKVKEFKMYPNPAYGEEIYITTASNDKKNIKVYDVFGEIVLADQIVTNTLNIARLVPGIYVLQMTESNKTMTRKLVIK